jgi:CyaY protein
MTDPEFMDLAESLLRSVERVCDSINDTGSADIDNQRVGAMVTLVFADRSQIIINLQKPLHEVWMASRFGGYHFSWLDGSWQDTKGQGDFCALLGSDASAQAGVPLQFAA